LHIPRTVGTAGTDLLERSEANVVDSFCEHHPHTTAINDIGTS